jgi:hypothetical protein
MHRAHRYPPNLDEQLQQLTRRLVQPHAPLHGVGGLAPKNQPPCALSLEEFCAKIDFHPDRKQELVLASTSKRIIINGSRQSGKSHILAVRAVRTLISVSTRPKLALIVAKTMAQAKETILKMDLCFAALNLRTHGEPGQELARVLPNGSRIIGLAADDGSVRSYTADLVILDEAARVPDDVWDAIEPTLATTNGDLIIASTPEGKRGLFWETWTNGGPEWLKVQTTVHECPRVAKDFIESQRRKGDAFFKQEYECQFVEAGLYLLGRDQVERLVTDKERPL